MKVRVTNLYQVRLSASRGLWIRDLHIAAVNAQEAIACALNVTDEPAEGLLQGTVECSSLNLIVSDVIVATFLGEPTS